MILTLDDGNQIRGDLIVRAALRTDLAPIPVTLEADIRADESLLAKLREGGVLTTGMGDRLQIVYSQPVQSGQVQGDRMQTAVRLVAFLEDCAAASYVRERAIIKEAQPLLALYRAAGCKLRSVQGDFPVDRFACLIGGTPTFHIARALQEAGGVVRWKNGRLQFIRLLDILDQEPAISLPNSSSDDVQSSFLERHEAPWFYSLAADGSVVQGNRTKARTAEYAPRMSAMALQNMTRCLVRRKVSKTDYAGQLCAGDVVQYRGGDKMAIITACHYFSSGTDQGGAQESYTRLWVGTVNK